MTWEISYCFIFFITSFNVSSETTEIIFFCITSIAVFWLFFSIFCSAENILSILLHAGSIKFDSIFAINDCETPDNSANCFWVRLLSFLIFFNSCGEYIIQSNKEYSFKYFVKYFVIIANYTVK